MSTRKTKQKKYDGAALLLVVLSSFLIFSTLTAVTINIASQMVRNEAWQSRNAVHNRLMIFARSAAIAATQALVEDSEFFGDAVAIASGVSSEKVTIIDDSETGVSNELEMKIQGMLSHIVFVAATAYEGDKKATVTARIDMTSTPKKIRWNVKK